MAILRQAVPSLAVTGDDEYESADGAWFQTLVASASPRTSLKVYLSHLAITQAQLSEKTGIPIPHVSAMELDKRLIKKITAKKFASVFGPDYRRFL